MHTYTLREPVVAVQYAHSANEAAVMDLIKHSRSSPSSYTNARGFLHVYNGGQDLEVRDGDWVVLLDHSVVVLPSEQFDRLFVQA